MNTNFISTVCVYRNGLMVKISLHKQKVKSSNLAGYIFSYFLDCHMFYDMLISWSPLILSIYKSCLSINDILKLFASWVERNFGRKISFFYDFRTFFCVKKYISQVKGICFWLYRCLDSNKLFFLIDFYFWQILLPRVTNNWKFCYPNLEPWV